MSPANKIFGRGWIVLGCLLGVSLAFDKTEAQDEDLLQPGVAVAVAVVPSSEACWRSVHTR